MAEMASVAGKFVRSSRNCLRPLIPSSIPAKQVRFIITVISSERRGAPARPPKGLPGRSGAHLHGIELDLVDITPAPVLTRLGGLHDGVAGRVEVFRRVLVPGGVATADVAARQTEPQMHPLVPAGQALLAALRVGGHGPDLFDVRTGVPGHWRVSLLLLP